MDYNQLSQWRQAGCAYRSKLHRLSVQPRDSSGGTPAGRSNMISSLMAKFAGNIFTKARGSIGSTTFSEARDRQGKVQTARQRVTPINPQTPDQVSARDNMSDSVFLVKGIIARGLASPFDRSVSKLPAYQSLLSLYQNAKSVVGSNIVVQGEPITIPGGDQFFFDISSVVNFNDGTYTINHEAVPANHRAVFGVITRSMPVADISTFRFENFSNSSQGDQQSFVDMGGFPGQNSGILVFGFFAPQVPAPLKAVSQIVWALSN